MKRIDQTLRKLGQLYELSKAVKSFKIKDSRSMAVVNTPTATLTKDRSK